MGNCELLGSMKHSSALSRSLKVFLPVLRKLLNISYAQRSKRVPYPNLNLIFLNRTTESHPLKKKRPNLVWTGAYMERAASPKRAQARRRCPVGTTYPYITLKAWAIQTSERAINILLSRDSITKRRQKPRNCLGPSEEWKKSSFLKVSKSAAFTWEKNKIVVQNKLLFPHNHNGAIISCNI